MLTDQECKRDEEILKELIKIREMLQLKEARIQTKKVNKRLKKEAKNREQLERITLTIEDFKLFVEMLDKDAEPNKSLKELLKLTPPWEEK